MDGEISGTHILETAAEEVSLCVEADRRSLKADGADLSFLTVSLRDKDGRENLQVVKEVTVQVEGAGTTPGLWKRRSPGAGKLPGYHLENLRRLCDGGSACRQKAGRREGNLTAEAVSRRLWSWK